MVLMYVSLMTRKVDYLLAIHISFVILCVVDITVIFLIGMSPVFHSQVLESPTEMKNCVREEEEVQDCG